MEGKSSRYVRGVGSCSCLQRTMAPGVTAMSEFHRLVEHEIPRLRRYARALTRETNRADDLVQDTLVRAISKSHLWQVGTESRAWLGPRMATAHVSSVA